MPGGHVNIEHYLRHFVVDEDATLIVEIYEGKVIGYSIAELAMHPPVLENGAFGSIMVMAVKNEHRGSEVGTMMFDHLKDWFEKKGKKGWN
jgi:GNAT superfamily N-acetyltransferase